MTRLKMAPKMAFFKLFSCFGEKNKKAKDQSLISKLEETTKAPGQIRYIVDVVLHKVERCDFSTRDQKRLFIKRNEIVHQCPVEFGPPENQDFINEGDLVLEEL